MHEYGSTLPSGRMSSKQLLQLVCHLGIVDSAPQGPGQWRGRALAAKYAGFPVETGRLPRSKVGKALKDRCKDAAGKGISFAEFCLVMKDLARMLVLDEAPAQPAKRSGGQWGGAVTQGMSDRRRPVGITKLVLQRAILEAQAEGLLGGGGAKGRAETDRGGSRQGRDSISAKGGGQLLTDRGPRRKLPDGGESSRRAGSETERPGGGPRYTMLDMGAGYYRVSVNGGASRVISSDDAKLDFAREAKLQLSYKAPFRKGGQVEAPWGTAAAKGAWTDGTFLFDPAGIAGRVRGPDNARLDPYRGVDDQDIAAAKMNK